MAVGPRVVSGVFGTALITGVFQGILLAAARRAKFGTAQSFRGAAMLCHDDGGQPFISSQRPCRVKPYCQESSIWASAAKGVPSTYSRNAPPPVETCVILLSRPNSSTASAVSPPPTIVV